MLDRSRGAVARSRNATALGQRGEQAAVVPRASVPTGRGTFAAPPVAPSRPKADCGLGRAIERRLVMRWSHRTVLAAALLCVAPQARAAELRFSGFGDVVLGFTQGKTANPEAQLLFDSYGADPYPVNTNQGFGLTGTDFVVIADMTDDLTFLGELNLQAGRCVSNSIDLDVERFFANYRVNANINVQAGLFFTPIGFNNRFLYARAWLMNSIQVPDFYEEELNLIPT